jgi:YesN/AraC family two-component response regulator
MGNFEKSTLLIVDDEPFLLEMLAARLKIFGANILTAENGQAALEIVKTGAVDAVLTDIDMPVMNGLELLTEMRELGYLTPVVILTGVNDEAATLTALRLGATDFLDKPFDSKVIHEVMSKALNIGIATRSMETKIGSAESDGQAVSLEEFRKWKAAMVANVNTTPAAPKSVAKDAKKAK